MSRQDAKIAKEFDSYWATDDLVASCLNLNALPRSVSFFGFLGALGVLAAHAGISLFFMPLVVKRK